MSETGEKYYRVARVEDLPLGERILFEIGDQPIVIFNVSGQFYAIGDVCSHDNGPLGDGDLDEWEIICPRHGARFDIRDGKATRRPAVRPAPWYPTRIMEGWIEVGIPS